MKNKIKRETASKGKKKPEKKAADMTEKQIWRWAAGKVLDWDELVRFIDDEIEAAAKRKRRNKG